MVKSGGGTKRKIEKMEKITRREYRATTFTKRCNGLRSKAAQLCLLSGAQIAILATPPSSQSNVSFFSFGHSSVDAVVSAYLMGQRLAPVREEPRDEDIGVCMARKELGLELWWEKESLYQSKDPQEVMEAIRSIERMLCKLRSGGFVDNNERDSSHRECNEDNNEVTKSDVVLQDVDETLNLQAVCSVPEDGFDKITEEEDQMLAICDSFCAKEDNNNINKGLSGSLDVYNQEIDIDKLIDYGVLDNTQELQGSLLMNIEADQPAHDVSTNPSPPISVSESVEDEALVFQNKAANDDVSTNNPYPIYGFEGVLEEEVFVIQNRALDLDNLQFSDYFNQL